MPSSILLQSNLPGVPVRRGKVRDVYDFGDRLLFIATDRISAFDWILPTGIPDKGRILTQISRFWFARLNVAHHLLDAPIDSLPLPPGTDVVALRDRSLVVRKTQVFPIECVVRGYLAGSGWKEYRQQGTVCGLKLRDGLREADKLEEPIFTPATKAETGHDENIPFERAAEIIGGDVIAELRRLSLAIYQQAADYARTRGLIIADTKFEFGRAADGRLLLIDEVLTPDSSRFWPANSYQPGRNPPSFDKQFVRDWLETTGWDKQSPPPALPDAIVANTRAKYLEAYERLTGTALGEAQG
jgi:phosphoribosylaminoimidazole-succinocarboxamide synthase